MLDVTAARHRRSARRSAPPIAAVDRIDFPDRLLPPRHRLARDRAAQGLTRGAGAAREGDACRRSRQIADRARRRPARRLDRSRPGSARAKPSSTGSTRRRMRCSATERLPGPGRASSRDPLRRDAILLGPRRPVPARGHGQRSRASTAASRAVARASRACAGRTGPAALADCRLLVETLVLVAIAYAIGVGIGWLFFGAAEEDLLSRRLSEP